MSRRRVGGERCKAAGRAAYSAAQQAQTSRAHQGCLAGAQEAGDERHGDGGGRRRHCHSGGTAGLPIAAAARCLCRLLAAAWCCCRGGWRRGVQGDRLGRQLVVRAAHWAWLLVGAVLRLARCGEGDAQTMRSIGVSSSKWERRQAAGGAGGRQCASTDRPIARLRRFKLVAWSNCRQWLCASQDH